MFYAAAFAILAVVCTVFAFKRHPVWGLYFYMATIFVFPPGRWWGVFFGGMRWALFSALVTALAIAFHKGKLRDKPLWLSNGAAVLLALYAAWMWLQTPLALDVPDHLNGTVLFSKYLLAFWFVYRIADTKESLRDVMFGHLMGCALLGIFAYTTGRDGNRLDGVGGPGIDDSNTLGMYLVTGLMVGVGLVLTQKGWRRWFALFCMALAAEGFVLANSRGSFLGLVAGGLVIMMCKAKTHRRLFWAFAAAGVVGLFSILDEHFVDRMFTIGDVTSQEEDADTSARSRVVVAEAQLKMFADHPIGVGHRGTAVLSTKYLDPKWLTVDASGDPSSAARSSHNTFLSALVEQGILGAILFLSLVLWIVAAGLRVRRMRGPQHDPELATLGASMVGALMVILVSGNTADYLLAENQFWLLALLVSVLQMNSPERQRPGFARTARTRQRPPAASGAPELARPQHRAQQR